MATLKNITSSFLLSNNVLTTTTAFVKNTTTIGSIYSTTSNSHYSTVVNDITTTTATSLPANTVVNQNDNINCKENLLNLSTFSTASSQTTTSANLSSSSTLQTSDTTYTANSSHSTKNFIITQSSIALEVQENTPSIKGLLSTASAKSASVNTITIDTILNNFITSFESNGANKIGANSSSGSSNLNRLNTTYPLLSNTSVLNTITDSIRTNLVISDQDRNMFSEVFESGGGSKLESGALEDNNSSMGDGILEKNCKKCGSRLQNPRVLSCLHVFCENCLIKLLSADISATPTSTIGGNGSTTTTAVAAGDLVHMHLKTQIECPICKQTTVVGAKGLQSLTRDYITTNILDLATIESEHLSCTSCKSKENAISRCSDCANFLCSGCDNAHKYMRCFENHEVVKLEDLQKSSSDNGKPLVIHKPLYCHIHKYENLKYYCFNCQMPVCNDCLITDHKGSEHHYDVIALAEKSVRGDVENLMKEAKSKVQYCDDAAANLSSALNELQTQHDSARDLIKETFDKHRKILEKCRDKALNILEKLHSERELKIMDLLQNIENTMGKINNTCKFTNRVLEHANAAEFLAMKKLISNQFINLINTTPKCDINYSLTFDAKIDKFEQLVQDTFGKFRTESTPPSPKESTPPPTLPGMPPSMMNSRSGGMSCSNSSQGRLTGSVTASSPISLPTSMQSSFDGDLSVLGNGFMMSSVLGSDSPPQNRPPRLQQHLQQQINNTICSSNSGVNSYQSISSMTSGSAMGVGGGTSGGQSGPGGNNSLSSLLNGSVNGLSSVSGTGNNMDGVGSNGGTNNLNNSINSHLSHNGGSSGSGLSNSSMLSGSQGLNALNSTRSSSGSYHTGVLNNSINSGSNIVADLNGHLGNGGGSLCNGNAGNGVNGGMPVNNGGAPGGYNSILEYNLTRLASLSEATSEPNINDVLGPTHLNGNQTLVPASNSQNQHITLADLLSGDQRALNNLQALAKMGLNNNVDFHTDLMGSDQQFLSNGSQLSNGIDCFLSDYCLPGTPSPNLTNLSNLPPLPLNGNGNCSVDDMSISTYHGPGQSGSSANSSILNSTNILTGRSKATPMHIRCKFGSLGTSRGHFNSPHGFCLGVNEEIIVADTNNHRIEVFDKCGNLNFYFGVPGKEEGQLWYPRKVAVMHSNGKFIVCDRGNERSRMQIFSKNGHFLRKIAIRYIDIVAGLAVTSKGHIVAVDSVSPTVFVISEDGELVRWFDCSDYMREPSDIAIRDNDFYVCDFKGHCVAVFHEDGTFQYRIGNEKVTCFPNGIDISNAGDILIGDSHGNRFHVACYSRDGILQSEFECPHVKVSRCCGLKITSEGYVVTLAKNNHHVLVLNTLYVQ